MFKLARSTRWTVFAAFGVCSLLLLALLPLVGEARTNAVAPSLGTAASFAVLAGSTATNTGPTIVDGNLGVSPGSSITGFPPGVVVPPGSIHAADAVAAQAQSDVTTAYNNLTGQPCNFNLTGQDLGGKTLTPGVYCFPGTSAQLTGALSLDAQGDPNAVFIFQIGSTLSTASSSSVRVINGGTACNLFWQVGSSATLGTFTSFQGNILTLASITVNTSANIQPGRALARTGAVTLDTSTVSISGCPGQPGGTGTPLPATQTIVAATQTIVAPTETAIAATQTAIALTPPPPATQTAIAATLTSVAATQTIIAPTQTAIAATNTAIAATQTAIATLTATVVTPQPSLTPTSVVPTPRPPAEVPESDSLVLFGSGGVAFASYLLLRYRTRRKN